MKKMITTGILLGCLGFGIISTLQAAEKDKEPRSMIVQGQGKAAAIPDVAVLSIEVSQDGPELDPVLSQVRRDINKVLDALKKQDIADKDVRTELFRVQPKMEADKRGNARRVGFTVVNRVSVKVRDLKKTGKVLSAALGAGATTVNGPDFEIDNPQIVEKEALAAAVRDAKSKAETLAQAAGVTLGPILAMNPQQVAWPMQGRRFAARGMMMSEGMAAEEPIAAGEQTLMAHVTISFEIR